MCPDQQQQQSCRRRRVSFTEKPDVTLVNRIDSFYHDDVWYNSKELSKLEKHNTLTVRAIRRGKELDESLFCARGLEEQVSRRTRIARHETIVTVIQAVLDEQTRQEGDGQVHERDWLEIHRAAKSGSQRSLCDAINRAKEDEECLKAEASQRDSLDFSLLVKKRIPSSYKESLQTQTPMTSLSDALLVAMTSSTA